MDAFHQYLRRAVPGEPATAAVLARARLLQQLGFRSEIYASEMAVELAGLVRPLTPDTFPRDTPLVFQASGLPVAGAPLPPSNRLVLTASCTEAGHRAALQAWAEALGAQVCAMILETGDEGSGESAHPPAGIHFSPPVFEAARMARRSPLVPAMGPRSFLLLAADGHERSSWLDAVGDAALRLHQPIDVSFFGDANGRSRELRGHGELRTQGPQHPAELAGRLRRADLLLWSGEAPSALVLLAVAMGLPVLAAPTPAARAVLGDASASSWSDDTLRDALLQLLGERGARRALAERQATHVALAERRAQATLAAVGKALGLRSRTIVAPVPPGPRILVEGSFETSYSLDITNRGLARALERALPGQVGLVPTHGYGDYRPKDEQLAARPDLIALWQRGRGCESPEVVVRGMYPPRVNDMRGKRRLLYFAWEESHLPPAWVAEFNRCLDGLVVVSQFVRKVLIDAGVEVPIAVIGNGIDQVYEATPEPLPDALPEGFKFLHVSSAFPRKGIDVLLESFADAFGADDPVALVLKTFPNVHHDIERSVAAFRRRRPNSAPLVLINRDLSAGALAELYRRCDAVVAPSRGEGYGLPLAEAMAVGLPVITTGHGGQLDFCTPGTAWLVDFHFARARSHFGLRGSVWAEPDRRDLARALREVANASPSERKQITERARRFVLREHSWDRVAQRFTAALAALAEPPRPSPRVQWTTVGSSPAFAKRSRQLAAHVGGLGVEIATAEATLILLHAPLDEAAALRAPLSALDGKSLSVALLHSAKAGSKHPADELLFLRRADRVVVQHLEDLNWLKARGLVANVSLLPQRGAEFTRALASLLRALAKGSDRASGDQRHPAPLSRPAGLGLGDGVVVDLPAR